MGSYSHGANYSSTTDFRMVRNDHRISNLYHANMPRKSAQSNGLEPEQADWYLQEWMKDLRVSQAKLARECDWTPSTMHGIYHGRTNYYREILNLIASKLNIEPYELLMPPEQAMAFRRFSESAAEIVDFGYHKAGLREQAPDHKRAAGERE